MKKQTATNNTALYWRIAITVILIIGAVYVLSINWETVRSSLQVARQASLDWLVVALILMVLTFSVAAGIYSVLALHRLRYAETIVVEVATAFVNKLLPAGIGGLGLHGVYLHKRRHTVAEATVIVSVNNLLGMAAHLLLLFAVILFSPNVLQQLRGDNDHQVLSWQLAVGVVSVIMIILALPVTRRRLSSFMVHLLTSLRKLRVAQLTQALLLAMVLTATYTLILFCCARAAGTGLGLLQVFVAFSISMLASTATPTPGGLVGAEAGLFAGLIAYDVSSPTAGAVVLLYRLISYWLPLVPGLAALFLARKRSIV